MEAIRITIDDLGRAVVEIADAAGCLHPYRLVRLSPEPFTATLERCDTEQRHTITQETGARWHCTCRDYRYRGTKHEPRGCKHTLGMRSLRAFLRGLLPIAFEVVTEIPAQESCP